MRLKKAIKLYTFYWNLIQTYNDDSLNEYFAERMHHYKDIILSKTKKKPADRKEHIISMRKNASNEWDYFKEVNRVEIPIDQYEHARLYDENVERIKAIEKSELNTEKNIHS